MTTLVRVTYGEAAYIAVGVPTLCAVTSLTYDLILRFHKNFQGSCRFAVSYLGWTKLKIPRWINFAYLHFFRLVILSMVLILLLLYKKNIFQKVSVS